MIIVLLKYTRAAGGFEVFKFIITFMFEGLEQGQDLYVCVCVCVKPNRRHGFPSKHIAGVNFYVRQNTKHTKISKYA